MSEQRTVLLSTLARQNAAPIRALRLVDTGSGVRLLSSTTEPHEQGFQKYETRIASTRFDAAAGPPEPLVTVPHLLPLPPAWDVRLPDGEPPALVVDLAQGANYVVVRQGGGLPAAHLATKNRGGSVRLPRFVKRAPEEHRAAVSAVDGERRLLFFPAAPDGTASDAVEIVKAESGLVVAHRGALFAFYKTYLPGPVRGLETPRGRLCCARLGDDLRPSGPVSHPLGDAVVFEFDVDVMMDNLVVFATTEAGMALSVGAVAGGAFEVVVSTEDAHEEALSEPSVAARDGQIHIVALSSAGSERAALRVGAFSLDALRERARR